MTPDFVNFCFEMGGAIIIWRNIFRVLQDRDVKGISWMAVGFWSAWGFWNLFFYPHLGQWLSFVGAIVLVLGNTIHVCLMVKYLRLEGGWRLVWRRK